ncbi:MAG: acyl-CoA reductase [Polyangiales bacterium]
MSARVDAVMRAVSALRARDGGALRDAVRAASGCSEDAARWCVESVLARYSPAALDALRDARWEGRAVTVVLAATVPLAALRAVVLPLVQGATEVRVRPSRRQREIPERVIEALAAQGLPVHLDPGEPRGDVIAYGRDETLEALAGRLAPGARFEGHGHGFGAAVVRGGGAGVAAALARDVAAYEQQGCLSPQVVLCAGDARELAAALHAALSELAARWPRATMDLGVGAAALQWTGAQAALGAVVLRAPSHVVTVWDRPALQASPGARHIAVVPVRDLNEAGALLAPEARHLSCVGTDALEDPRWRPEGFAGRVCALGEMQDPPLDGPEDRRPPTRVTPR